MSLMKVIQENDCRPLYRMDFHISVIRWRFPQIIIFEQELSLVLSIMPFRCKYINILLQILSYMDEYFKLNKHTTDESSQKLFHVCVFQSTACEKTLRIKI